MFPILIRDAYTMVSTVKLENFHQRFGIIDTLSFFLAAIHVSDLVGFLGAFLVLHFRPRVRCWQVLEVTIELRSLSSNGW